METSMEENLRIMRSARFICMKKQWILQNLNYRKKKSEEVMWMDQEELIQKVKDGGISNCIYLDEVESFKL